VPNDRPTSRASRRIVNDCAKWSLVAVLLTSVFAGLAAVPSASASDAVPGLLAAGGTGWIPDVPVATDPGYAESDPAVTTAANGNLYMAYQANGAGNYDIFFTESNDGGLTWAAPVPVVNSATDEVTPSIAQDPFTGRTFVAYAFGTSGATPIRVAYSDDLLTWTVRTVLPCGVYCERPRIVSEYWNGTNNIQYVALAGTLSANDWNVAVARSMDDGVTWTWYESGLGATDVRYQPDITVQKGSDGVDRVYLFYRGGATFPPSAGYAEWSQNHGASWGARAQWYSNAWSPPMTASAHDGSSLLLAYSTNLDQVTWAQIPDPRDLASFTGTWDFLPTAGTRPAVSVDGAGSTSTTIGGSYYLVAHDTAGAVFHTQAPVTLTTNADWSSPVTISDVGSLPSTTRPELAVTTQDRGGTWYPAVTWTDERGGTPDIYYTTPGAGGGIDVTLTTSPAGLRVTLDGVTRVSPATYWVTPGFHTITVPSPQTGAPGWQYTYASWSDGGAISHVIDVSASAAYTATFSTQVQLTVNSAQGGVTGAGWYNLGTSATVTVTSPQAGAPGWQYRFTDWSGAISSTSPSVLVFMDEPKTVTANWQTQVLLTIQSANGGVTGDGWYDLNAYATASAELYVDGSPGTRYAFAAWTGDVSSANPNQTIRMDGPKAVTAAWQTQYLLTVTSSHGTAAGGGWYDQYDVATVTLPAGQVTEAGRTWEFTGWTGDASGIGSVVTVTMNGPRTVTANWREKDALITSGLWIPILLGAILAAILLAVLLLRRRKRQQPVYPQTQVPAPIVPSVQSPMPPAQPATPQDWPGQGPPPPSSPPPAP